jgi:hypothetical protein
VVGQLLLLKISTKRLSNGNGELFFDDQKPIRAKNGYLDFPKSSCAALPAQASFRRCFGVQTGVCKHPVDDAAVAPC